MLPYIAYMDPMGWGLLWTQPKNKDFSGTPYCERFGPRGYPSLKQLLLFDMSWTVFVWWFVMVRLFFFMSSHFYSYHESSHFYSYHESSITENVVLLVWNASHLLVALSAVCPYHPEGSRASGPARWSGILCTVDGSTVGTSKGIITPWYPLKYPAW